MDDSLRQDVKHPAQVRVPRVSDFLMLIELGSPSDEERPPDLRDVGCRGRD